MNEKKTTLHAGIAHVCLLRSSVSPFGFSVSPSPIQAENRPVLARAASKQAASKASQPTKKVGIFNFALSPWLSPDLDN